MKLLAILSLVLMMLPAVSWSQDTGAAVGPAPDDPCNTNETEGTEEVVGTAGTNAGVNTAGEAVGQGNNGGDDGEGED